MPGFEVILVVREAERSVKHRRVDEEILGPRRPKETDIEGFGATKRENGPFQTLGSDDRVCREEGESS